MLVVDTSAVLAALGDPGHRAAALMIGDPDLHAPHLIDVELIHAVRRLALHGHIDESQAHDLLGSFGELRIERYPHTPLTQRMWELRSNLTAYDAAFVALAELLGAPLVTADAKLRAAPGHGADVVLVTRR